MTSRPAKDSERSVLEAALSSSRKSQSTRLSMLFGPSVTLLLLLGLLWLVLRWAGRRFLGIELGLYSAAAPWILGVGALVLILVVGPEILKIVRRSKSAMSALEADLASGMVEDTTMRIIEAMRLQEPEHGGFLYFLRTADERVYVQFDYESQELGVDGQDPKASEYLPRDTLNVVRTHHESRVLASHFTGQPVPIVHTGKLIAKPKHWPEPDTFSDTPWNRLASTYAT
jgi:hypothetical protein